MLAVVDELTSRGIGFRSLTEGLHTDGPMGTAMLTIMAAFAQLERDTMIERTRAGLAAAAANGRKGGRPRKVDDADAAKARSLREKGITATRHREDVGRLPRHRVSVPHRWCAALCVIRSVPTPPATIQRIDNNGQRHAALHSAMSSGLNCVRRRVNH